MTKYIGTSGMIGVALRSEAILEGEGQHAGAGAIGIEPDMRAEGPDSLTACRLDEGRIGEQRGNDRLQRILPPDYTIDYAGESRQLRQESNTLLGVLMVAFRRKLSNDLLNQKR